MREDEFAAPLSAKQPAALHFEAGRRYRCSIFAAVGGGPVSRLTPQFGAKQSKQFGGHCNLGFIRMDNFKVALDNVEEWLRRMVGVCKFARTASPEVFCSALPNHWRSNKSLPHPFTVLILYPVPDGTKVTVSAGNEENCSPDIKNNIAEVTQQMARFTDLRFVGKSGRGKNFNLSLTIHTSPLKQVVMVNNIIKVTVDGPRDSRNPNRNSMNDRKRPGGPLHGLGFPPFLKQPRLFPPFIPSNLPTMVPHCSTVPFNPAILESFAAAMALYGVQNNSNAMFNSNLNFKPDLINQWARLGHLSNPLHALNTLANVQQSTEKKVIKRQESVTPTSSASDPNESGDKLPKSRRTPELKLETQKTKISENTQEMIHVDVETTDDEFNLSTASTTSSSLNSHSPDAQKKDSKNAASLWRPFLDTALKST
ncbi:unnamed protein product [Bursaphelenchus xylophilus]|uniref:(pine wood nematode) hypothetical protein n=1 Tax=Bursaphelenchus xylophilus TaxID=6326 RepID=A0A7I8XPI2_BURXY|nr:unnamed protein product [Bursaphelenchus xylophilus]CAG9087015.1 unnamed protein product [Bursaphelenchus xylophilus]